MDISPLVFWVISAVVIGSALAVVLSKNIVHSALFLILTFLAVAGLYGQLGVDYIAAVQILVYAGAIAILIVFGIMLTRRGDMADSNLFSKYKFPGIAVSAGFIAVTVYMISLNDFPSIAGNSESAVRLVAMEMFNDFVVPFEGAAIILLIAMVGAVMIARGGKKE